MASSRDSSVSTSPRTSSVSTGASSFLPLAAVRREEDAAGGDAVPAVSSAEGKGVSSGPVPAGSVSSCGMVPSIPSAASSASPLLSTAAARGSGTLSGTASMPSGISASGRCVSPSVSVGGSSFFLRVVRLVFAAALFGSGGAADSGCASPGVSLSPGAPCTVPAPSGFSGVSPKISSSVSSGRSPSVLSGSAAGSWFMLPSSSFKSMPSPSVSVGVPSPSPWKAPASVSVPSKELFSSIEGFSSSISSFFLAMCLPP
ncbi:hypothetical protein IMSAGC019_02631 [Lachnospiraceae bacterium]|nr:hypothetical protein IMSAGC019_02631 [Lachnospiraceae bacterium]